LTAEKRNVFFTVATKTETTEIQFFRHEKQLIIYRRKKKPVQFSLGKAISQSRMMR